MVKNFKNKYIKNQNGYVDMITIVPIVIIVLTLLSFFIDIATYSQQYLTVRKTTDNILRSICVQGRVSTNIPTDYPGRTQEERSLEFVQNSEIVEYLDEVFEGANIRPSTTGGRRWTIRIEIDERFNPANPENPLSGQVINNLTNNMDVRANYGSDVTVRVSYTYRWINGSESNVNIKRTGTTEYRHRTGNWEEG